MVGFVPGTIRILAKLRPKDGLCVGMLPMNDPDQIAENAALVAELSAARP